MEITLAPEVITALDGMLREVSEASVKRYAATLGVIKQGESAIGSIHSEDTKRLFVLAGRLDKLEDRWKASSELAETPAEAEEHLSTSARYGMYQKLANAMRWCQIHEDIGCSWDISIGIRENWVVVRCAPNDSPLSTMLNSLREKFGGG